MKVLIVLSGRPGVGKTTLAREIAALTGAVHLRIDTIEAALASSGVIAAAGGWDRAPDSGYQVGYALASDLLRARHDVIADSVNPFATTRAAWLGAAKETGSEALTVEVSCSDTRQHRRRIEERTSDLQGLIVPNWQQVVARDYEPWVDASIHIDTSSGTETAAAQLVAALGTTLIPSLDEYDVEVDP